MRIIVAVLTGLVLLGGCASARRTEPIAGALPADAVSARGERVFMAKCHQCHPNGEAGLGPAINNKPLPGFMMKTQVRLGVGAMPRFSAEDITPDDLDAVVASVKAVRRNG